MALRTYTTILTDRDWRAKTPENLARRLYGVHASVNIRANTEPSGRVTSWWEVVRPTNPKNYDDPWEWVDDITQVD